MKKIFAMIVAAPVLALFAGAGVLAWNISRTWDARNTDALISGMIAACSMGGIVVAGILAAIVGIPLAMRLIDQWQQGERFKGTAGAWNALPPPSNQVRTNETIPKQLDYREPRPPTIEMREEGGSWQSAGPGAYDLWEDADSTDLREFK
ncbi:hypothetical protein KFU94_00355 [Chloroflexi bacterium TSY]|nr:hypothetical protein [Chloroflexi bacterium TSY]